MTGANLRFWFSPPFAPARPTTPDGQPLEGTKWPRTSATLLAPTSSSASRAATYQRKHVATGPTAAVLRGRIGEFHEPLEVINQEPLINGAISDFCSLWLRAVKNCVAELLVREGRLRNGPNNPIVATEGIRFYSATLSLRKVHRFQDIFRHTKNCPKL